jgi:hypothetical protein
MFWILEGHFQTFGSVNLIRYPNIWWILFGSLQGFSHIFFAMILQQNMLYFAHNIVMHYAQADILIQATYMRDHCFPQPLASPGSQYSFGCNIQVTFI